MPKASSALAGNARNHVTGSLEQRVLAISRQIQKDYGVKVIRRPLRAPNPYDMSTDEAVALMKKAGILTKGGKLSRSYK